MKNYSQLKVFVAACGGLAFFGVAMLSLGAILPRLTGIAGVNTLPSVMSAGIIAGTLVFGPVADRFGYKWLLVAGQSILLCGIIGLAVFRDIVLLRSCILCVGLGGGILNGETNALVSDIFDDKKRGRYLSLLGACYCAGALLWSLLCTVIETYTIPLGIVSALMFLLLIYCCVIRFPDTKQPAGKMKKAVNPFQLLRYPGLIFLSVILFFQSGFEGISGNFTVTFLTLHGLASAPAAFSLTMFTIGMLAGRLALGWLVKRLKDDRALVLYLLVALAGAVLLYMNPGNPVAAYISMTLIGFGVGATFPVILSHLGGLFRGMSGAAFSVAIFIALCGQFLFNFITGRIFDAGGEGIFPVILSGIVVIMILLVPFAARITKNVK